MIHQLSANANQFSAEHAINSAQDFYRVQRPCSSIERKYFGQLPVEVLFKVSLKSHLKVRDGLILSVVSHMYLLVAC